MPAYYVFIRKSYFVDLTATTEWEINRRATRVGTFEVCVSIQVALRMLIMQAQLQSLATRNLNVEMAVRHYSGQSIVVSVM